MMANGEKLIISRGGEIKKIIVFILLTFFSCIFLGNEAFATSDATFKINVLKNNPNVILVNQDYNQTKLDVKKLANEGKMVYAYNTYDFVFDYYANDVLEDVHAISYYYDENTVFTMERLVFANSNLHYSSKKEIALNEHFDKSYEDFSKTHIIELKSFSDSMGEVVIDLNAGPENDFELARVKYKNTVIEANMKGYFIYTSYLYRFFVDGFTLYRVDSAVQFTSGNSASSSENFDSRFRAHESSMSATLSRHVEYGYGVWYSNQPWLLDYYPHTTPVYRSITSGISLGLTLGQTQSATVSGGTDTGASATSEFTSSFSIQYFYQATSEFIAPLLSSGELSSSEGSFWSLSEWGLERSVTVFPGSLIEVEPSSYGMRFEGRYNLSISFEVRRPFLWFFLYSDFSHSTTIYLDKQI